MDPTEPFNVSVVVLIPVHTVVLPWTVPPAEAGFTVTVTTLLNSESQTPLFTRAR